ncbi:MAG: superoxide dismutase family protein [Clostridiales bacterium]|jgi:Cu-Zn family superoxide dismutase|nr:superoxide dismutase family protein [Clostridiales bacterium]
MFFRNYAERAIAVIKGGPHYPNINGEIEFRQLSEGVEVIVRVHNLPPFYREGDLAVGPFGFHIHDGNSCEPGTQDNPFPETGAHYNPTNAIHPNHAGDLPIIMPMSDGSAFMRFITDRFRLNEVLGKPVLIHQSPDDFRAQPAGNSGLKIACGIITPIR